jgi:hypothetical protein
VMRDYLAWRGRLNDREAALFLTDERCPYSDNGKAAGGQMKTAFRGMVKRAAGTWRARFAPDRGAPPARPGHRRPRTLGRRAQRPCSAQAADTALVSPPPGYDNALLRRFAIDDGAGRLARSALGARLQPRCAAAAPRRCRGAAVA